MDIELNVDMAFITGISTVLSASLKIDHLLYATCYISYVFKFLTFLFVSGSDDRFRKHLTDYEWCTDVGYDAYIHIISKT